MRTRAFLLPEIPLQIGVPIIDRKGRRGIVVDKWFSAENRVTRVKVCRVRRYDAAPIVETYNSLDVRVDFASDMGYVHALREYLKLANAKTKENIRPYAWTWGGLQEQATKWWADMIERRDEDVLTAAILRITETQEN